MKLTERRAALSLASIYAFRMLGLFMILPVFTLYADKLQGSTPMLIGIALGVYGLTQALLQIPFGMLSDRLGRKPIIATGLIIFAIGSVVAALGTSINAVIVGRALQGAGAIGSTLIALLADLTSEENRTKAMAVIGLTIGSTFTIAIVLGPALNTIIHVSGIFWLTAVLAILGIIFLWIWVPTPTRNVFHHDTEPVPGLFSKILGDRELLRLNAGIMILHMLLTATFVVIPVALQDSAGLIETYQWYLYLPVMIVAFLIMVPLIIISEKRRKMKPFFLAAILALVIAQFSLWQFHQSIIAMGLSLLLFFTAFSFLEASLPSLISKRAPSGSKGTAMGVYSSSQFLGIFLGGALGGWLYDQHHFASVFLALAILALVWFLLAAGMQKPRYLATRMLDVGTLDEGQAKLLTDRLLTVKGVAEAVIIIKEGVAYLKVDNAELDQDLYKTVLDQIKTSEKPEFT